MSDGYIAHSWPYQTFLPRHPEPVEEQEPGDGRVPGLVVEAN